MEDLPFTMRKSLYLVNLGTFTKYVVNLTIFTKYLQNISWSNVFGKIFLIVSLIEFYLIVHVVIE